MSIDSFTGDPRELIDMSFSLTELQTDFRYPIFSSCVFPYNERSLHGFGCFRQHLRRPLFLHCLLGIYVVVLDQKLVWVVVTGYSHFSIIRHIFLAFRPWPDSTVVPSKKITTLHFKLRCAWKYEPKFWKYVFLATEGCAECRGCGRKRSRSQRRERVFRPVLHAGTYRQQIQETSGSFAVYAIFWDKSRGSQRVEGKTEQCVSAQSHKVEKGLQRGHIGAATGEIHSDNNRKEGHFESRLEWIISTVSAMPVQLSANADLRSS